MGASGPVESTMIRLVVVKKAQRFGIWLSSYLEILAVCDILNGNLIYVDGEEDFQDFLKEDDGY